MRTALYYALAPAAGTRAVTATFSAPVTAGLGLASFVGVSQLSPFGAVANHAATSTGPNVNLTIGDGNASLFAIAVDATTSTIHFTLGRLIATNGGGSSPNRLAATMGYDFIDNNGTYNLADTINVSRAWVMTGVELVQA